MEWIIIVLVIINIFLVLYFFCIKKEINRITKEIRTIHNTSSNTLLHTEKASYLFLEEIEEINALLIENRLDKIQYEKKKENLKNMMINISHDLRTPLTSALGYMDMILYSNLIEEEKIKELNIVFERLKRLEELIETFFVLSKMEDDIMLENVNIIGVLEQSIAHYYEDYKKEKREIILFNKCPKIIISSNRDMLSRIFDNLISNAFKYSSGNLEIKLEEKEQIVITFTNELLNSELEIDKIFDRFYTVDVSRTSGNTGLGLAIVKEFTEQLNGNVSAQIKDKKLEIVLIF